jgi:hypothetical protein
VPEDDAAGGVQDEGVGGKVSRIRRTFITVPNQFGEGRIGLIRQQLESGNHRLTTLRALWTVIVFCFAWHTPPYEGSSTKGATVNINSNSYIDIAVRSLWQLMLLAVANDP